MKAAEVTAETIIDQAIALLHDLTVVTRNTADFASTGVALLNPFDHTNELPPSPNS